jgi:hypothetical protein
LTNALGQKPEKETTKQTQTEIKKSKFEKVCINQGVAERWWYDQRPCFSSFKNTFPEV